LTNASIGILDATADDGGGPVLRDLRGGLAGILMIAALTGLIALGGYLLFDAHLPTFGSPAQAGDD
jgi:hypothetical protein